MRDNQPVSEVEGVVEVENEVQGFINQEKQEHAQNEPEGFSIKFQIFATLLVVCSAAAGGMLGIIMSNNGVSLDIVSWFALPGDLFIRALKCVVLPLVFVNVIIAVIQMVEAGKAGAVGKWTVIIYFLTTFVAALEGLITVLIFRSEFSTATTDPDPEFVNILCPFSGYAIYQNGNQVSCMNMTEMAESEANQFTVADLNQAFETTGEQFEVISFSETLQNGIFKQLVTENIVAEFANGGFVGVVMFGIIFGAASQALQRKPVLLLNFLQEVNDILVRIIEWIILLTPLAVFSLIAGALAAQEDLAKTFKDIGILVGAAMVAISAHLLIVYPGMYFFFTRENPYKYMKHIIPAQIFAFSCASSAATLPVTSRCVKSTGLVPDSIRDFVLPIGATVNMDGTALYFPCALVFLANTAGLESGFAEFFLIVLVSTIGSAGAAPVPNAGLVLIITAFNTVYGGNGTPDNFAIIVGIDWLMDRFQTALNITGDSMVCRIVTKLADAGNPPDLPTSQLSINVSEPVKSGVN